MDIMLQVDSDTIVPPYLEVDWKDRSIPDLSAVFLVSIIESFWSLKRYFSKMPTKSEKWNIYCLDILAQNITFQELMDIARALLMNRDFGLFSKASDHESLVGIGWLLYSTRQHDEERISDLLSRLLKEKIDAKWKSNKDQ
jgi:hypothetical protein